MFCCFPRLLLAIAIAACLAFPGTCDVASDGSVSNAIEDNNTRAPIFDESVPTNITANVGKSAYLTCRVRNLTNHTVSWFRQRDSHILTSQTYTYTSDQRFAVIHKVIDEWTLQIKWAQRRDAGTYMCQISTTPVRSYNFTLHVIVPSARILGAPDLHVNVGSTINLTCVVKHSPEAPGYIIWYHEDEVITFDGGRGGVSVVTERAGLSTSSSLLVQAAQSDDSGRYSCAPSNADLAAVRVHVLNGQRPEAMHTGAAGISDNSLCVLALLVMIALHSLWLQALVTS